MEQIFPKSDTSASEPNPQAGETLVSKLQGNIIIGLLCLGIILGLWSILKPNPKWEYKIVAVPDLLFESGMAQWEMTVGS